MIGGIPATGKGALANTAEAVAAFMTEARKQKITALVSSYLQKFKLASKADKPAKPAKSSKSSKSAPEWT